jgi:hypothetical protein
MKPHADSFPMLGLTFPYTGLTSYMTIGNRTDLHLLEEVHGKTAVAKTDENKKDFARVAADAQREFPKEEEGKES